MRKFSFRIFNDTLIHFFNLIMSAITKIKLYVHTTRTNTSRIKMFNMICCHNNYISFGQNMTIQASQKSR
ncbi:hypothetical protein GLOIN_2v1703639 [Rhizophagus irregularis DAOM 181602=DAOM 197198]|uniref:Uncharacterized protein n=1 Tax=Rhizophagus irregularis (strain DAOM 181602 / DAOM 197198 / MUCL 43194) TaxID=747089 RepID=A0A2P4P812_RHIID|nr:hypothetical protein GLOIN_2v1703639 [Rhizophagus irregularis DAOM 181602=DAOM 197198]POG61525.1 hypothetical protein GLOIN_2v1703639 [Rhizophagus irregularis DAOM 181602=DAOM 197198]|eukprot:XP_025168391.1 hypothetical protein GLOIN_2v1703639 [Rhizophagus irregularis DAOM 181602=DAOM 197198]